MKIAVYSGSLQTKKKAELREIATALTISDAGTREEVQQRIRKHLDDNRASYEDNPIFSSLYTTRRRRAVYHLNVPSSPTSESTEDVSDKKLATPPSTRSVRRNALGEATPAPDAQEVSMILRHAPLSPPEGVVATAPPASTAPTPQKDRSIVYTSTPRSIMRNIPKSPMELADTTFKSIHIGAEQRARVYLPVFRSTLSNSANISFITALLELLYILYQVIPWRFLEVLDTGGWKLSVPYPPMATLQSPVFWSVLLHWSMPTLIIPAVIGSIISFHPANAASVRAPRVLPFDSLTASITRLAAQYGYPYKALNATVQGIDVIGPQWRVLNAAVGVAFAFAEAIFAAPGAIAELRARQRAGTPRRTIAADE